jgi:hypothetical protein
MKGKKMAYTKIIDRVVMKAVDLTYTRLVTNEDVEVTVNDMDWRLIFIRYDEYDTSESLEVNIRKCSSCGKEHNVYIA